MSEIINLNKESFDKVTSSGTNTQIIDFWAPWCGPCKALTPVLEEVSQEMGDKVEIYKVNVDDNTDLAQEHGVQSIPTMLVYKMALFLKQSYRFKNQRRTYRYCKFLNPTDFITFRLLKTSQLVFRIPKFSKMCMLEVKKSLLSF